MDLPAPEWPTSATVSCTPIVNDTPCRTSGRSGPYAEPHVAELDASARSEPCGDRSTTSETVGRASSSSVMRSAAADTWLISRATPVTATIGSERAAGQDDRRREPLRRQRSVRDQHRGDRQRRDHRHDGQRVGRALLEARAAAVRDADARPAARAAGRSARGTADPTPVVATSRTPCTTSTTLAPSSPSSCRIASPCACGPAAAARRERSRPAARTAGPPAPAPSASGTGRPAPGTGTISATMNGGTHVRGEDLDQLDVRHRRDG